MRLIDLDDFAQSNVTGKTAVLKVLEKWEQEHPLEKIVIREDDEWTITMQRNHAAAEELMKWKHAVQSQESEEDREKRIKKVCKKCIYWSGCCNYILDEGHQRPCPSTMCKEAGVYVRGKRKPGTAKRWNEGLF